MLVSSDGPRRTPTLGVSRVAVAIVLTLALALATGAAQAAPALIPFDGPGNYGFSDIGSVDPAVTNEIADWDYVADAENAPDSSVLLFIHRVGFERCNDGSAQCTGSAPAFDVEWDIELNENFNDGGRTINPGTGGNDVNIFLATWNSDPQFADNLVSIFYDSLSVSGVDTEFEVASYLVDDTEYWFLSVDLSGMLAGESNMRRLSFRYQVEGELVAGAQNVTLVPFVGAAAYFTVPEPGTAVLLGLGLAAIALGRRREAR